MHALNVKSALDLREEPGACKKAAEHSVITAMAVGPIQVTISEYERKRLVFSWHGCR